MYTENQIPSLTRSIEDIFFSVRTRNCLRTAKISNVAHLLTFTRKDLNGITNLGPGSYTEILKQIDYMGFQVGELSPHKQALKSSKNVEETLRSLNLISAERPDAPLGAWVQVQLPGALRDSISKEFLNAVLDDPKTQERVSELISTIVSEKLGPKP